MKFVAEVSLYLPATASLTDLPVSCPFSCDQMSLDFARKMLQSHSQPDKDYLSEMLHYASKASKPRTSFSIEDILLKSSPTSNPDRQSPGRAELDQANALASYLPLALPHPYNPAVAAAAASLPAYACQFSRFIYFLLFYLKIILWMALKFAASQV